MLDCVFGEVVLWTHSSVVVTDPRHLIAIERALSHGRFAVLTDIDGTLSPLARSPWEARVSARARQILVDLCETVELVAAVTGRSAVDARALVGLPNLVYVGNHGLEVLAKDELEVVKAAAAWTPVISATIASVAEKCAPLPGLYCENKGVTGSIHYRGTIAPEAARLAVLASLGEIPTAGHLRVSEGRMVVELRPPVEANKGTAVLNLLDQWAIDAAVYFGDDATDADAMIALAEWSLTPGKVALSFGVLSDETPPSIEKYAGFTLRGVPAVLDLLSATARFARRRFEAGRRTDGLAKP